MNNFDQSKQSVNQQFNAVFITPPLEMIKELCSTVSQWFGSMLPAQRDNNYYETFSQFNDQYNARMQRIEQQRFQLQEMNFSDRSYVESKQIQLREEEIKIQNEKLEWEKAVSQYNFKLIQSSQSIAIKTQQNETDKHYLYLEVSRDDIIQIFSQNPGRLLVISSPPELLCDDIPAFKSLKAEVSVKLEQCIPEYYGRGDDSFILYRKNIFKSSINQSQAEVVGKWIPQISKLIFHSQVAHQKFFIWVTLTCPILEEITQETQTGEIKVHQKTFNLLELNWINLKRKLEAQGKDYDDISQSILDLISTIHVVVALYFCDLYFLNLNLNHSPKLFEFLLKFKSSNCEFANDLQEWSQPLENSLREKQKEIQEKLDEIRAYQAMNERRFDNDNDDFPNVFMIVTALGLVLLFTMFSQQSPNLTQGNAGTQIPTGQQQAKTGVIQVDRADKNAARLRVSPDLSSKIITDLPNGTPVVLGKISSDGQWQWVTTQDGRSGWVWAESIQQ